MGIYIRHPIFGPVLVNLHTMPVQTGYFTKRYSMIILSQYAAKENSLPSMTWSSQPSNLPNPIHILGAYYNPHVCRYLLPNTQSKSSPVFDCLTQNDKTGRTPQTIVDSQQLKTLFRTIRHQLSPTNGLSQLIPFQIQYTSQFTIYH